MDRRTARVIDAVMPGITHVRLIALALLAAALIGVACSDSEDRPVIRAGGFNFPESHLLSWIFALGFQDAGFDVDTSQIQPGDTREIQKPALEDGLLDYVPEYTGSLLSELGGEPTSDSDANYSAAKEMFAERGVAVLAYAPAQNQNAFVVTREFSEERGITSLSDLAPIADELRFGAPPECPVRTLCAIGLRTVYDIEFDEFIPLDALARNSALTQGTADVVLLFTTDAVLAVSDWVVLEDDRGLLPAENVALALRQAIVDAYGDELVSVVEAISAELTTDALSELNRQVEVDGVDAETAARSWLEERELIDD